MHLIFSTVLADLLENVVAHLSSSASEGFFSPAPYKGQRCTQSFLFFFFFFWQCCQTKISKGWFTEVSKKLGSILGCKSYMKLTCAHKGPSMCICLTSSREGSGKRVCLLLWNSLLWYEIHSVKKKRKNMREIKLSIFSSQISTEKQSENIALAWHFKIFLSSPSWCSAWRHSTAAW